MFIYLTIKKLNNEQLAVANDVVIKKLKKKYIRRASNKFINYYQKIISKSYRTFSMKSVILLVAIFFFTNSLASGYMECIRERCDPNASDAERTTCVEECVVSQMESPNKKNIEEMKKFGICVAKYNQSTKNLVKGVTLCKPSFFASPLVSCPGQPCWENCMVDCNEELEECVEFCGGAYGCHEHCFYAWAYFCGCPCTETCSCCWFQGCCY